MKAAPSRPRSGRRIAAQRSAKSSEQLCINIPPAEAKAAYSASLEETAITA